MKSTVVCMLALILMLMSSCNDSEDNTAQLLAKLYGEWKSTSYFREDCDVASDNKSLRPLFDCNAFAGCRIYIFEENGDMEVRTHDDRTRANVYPGTYTLENDILTVCTDRFTDCWIFQISFDEATKKDDGIVILEMKEKVSATTGCRETIFYE